MFLIVGRRVVYAEVGTWVPMEWLQ